MCIGFAFLLWFKHNNQNTKSQLASNLFLLRCKNPVLWLTVLQQCCSV